MLFFPFQAIFQRSTSRSWCQLLSLRTFRPWRSCCCTTLYCYSHLHRCRAAIWAHLFPHASFHVAFQVILKLQGSQLPDSSQLQQYSLRCEEEDKFLLIYTLLRLRLVQGKTLVFVGALDRCYRLKLFLEQFGVPACVLNSELPVQSRWGLLCCWPCHLNSNFKSSCEDFHLQQNSSDVAHFLFR